MKKGTFFMMLAAAASLASCTAQGPKANLKSDVDSLSYMMGVTNTQGLMEYVQGRLGVDSAYVADVSKVWNKVARKLTLSRKLIWQVCRLASR